MEGSWRSSGAKGQRPGSQGSVAFHSRRGGRGGHWGTQGRPRQAKQALPNNVKAGSTFEARITKVDQQLGTFVEVRDAATGILWTGLIRNLHVDNMQKISVTVTTVQQETGRVDLIWTPPTPPPNDRPLLILDLNGVILDRKKYDKRSKGNNSYTKRPYCDQFIRFCFENFRVGVWSCGMKKNMELELFNGYKDLLLFIYDQEKSTNLWPKRSIVSPGKPLFLKELSHVWKEFPQYNATNTILIDNHLEKFQRNPVGTCMLVAEYDSTNPRKDGTLSFDGEIVKHLVAMSTCGNIPEYMHSTGLESIFPSKHPELEGKAPEPDAAVTGGSSSTRSNFGSDGSGHGTKELRFNFAKQFTSSNIMKANCPERDAQFYMRHRDTPGPRAVPFSRKHFASCLADKQTGFVVCEKTDGVRSFLYAPVGPDRATYFVDRAWNFSKVRDPKGSLYNILTNSGSGTTMLDGEVVSQQGVEPAFVVFDVVWVHGVDVGAIPHLMRRLEHVSAILASLNELLPSSQVGLGALVAKQFKQLNQVNQLAASVDSHEYDKGVGTVHCDGLVITPVREVYYAYTVLKYKPKHELTVDFKLYLKDIRDSMPPIYLLAYIPSSGRQQQHGNRQQGGSRVEIELSKLLMNPDIRNTIEDQLRSESNSRQNYVIVECYFDGEMGIWCYRNCRLDKVKPNYLSSAWKVMESLAENVTVNDFVKLWENATNLNEQDVACDGDDTQMKLSADASPFVPPTVAAAAPPSMSGAAGSHVDNVEAVAQHYNERQMARNMNERSRDDIHALRKINNWAKAVMVNEWFAASNQDNDSFPSMGTTKEFVSLPQELRNRSERPKNRRNAGKQRNNKPLHDVDCMDVACGRGGDLLKWTASLKIQNLVGLDIARVALDEADRRIREQLQRGGGRGGKNNPKTFSFIHADAADPNLVNIVRDATHNKDIAFDCIAVQFSFHYWCDTRERCNNFLKSMSQLIKPGGRLVITTTDSDAIRMRVEENGSNEFRNSVCSVVMQGSMEHEAFGTPYLFTLGDAVVDCKEYMVPAKLVEDIAKESGFNVVYSSNLGKFVQNAVQVKQYRELMQDMKVTMERGATMDEWEVIQLYKIMLLEKP